MRIKVRPATGLKIRDERTKQFLPAEGAEVEHSNYWQRRIDRMDVILVEQEKEPSGLKDPEANESPKASSKKAGDKK